ncbi:hypothetical protein GCM10027053_51590 [Intrasporangium mesophilum]
MLPERSPQIALPGPVLRAMRDVAGMSQTDLAQAAGVSASHLSYFEAGKRHMAKAKVDAALEVLTVRLAQQGAPSVAELGLVS